MSSTITLVQTQQDPDEEPIISPELLRYIHSLDESPACYARFFDALLIKKSSHGQFFRDLKAFREQPVIIALLEPGSKEAYRECTRSFIGSRFAHPWCRTNSDFQSGWTRASWVGGTKKVSKEDKKEEERLHRLLVPIWIAFRRRMFPENEVLEDWIANEGEREKQRLAEAEAEAATKSDALTVQHADDASPSSATAIATEYPELGFKTKANPSGDAAPAQSSDSNANTAAQMFLGVAVTGFIMSDKRVRKYVEKKLKKKKKR